MRRIWPWVVAAVGGLYGYGWCPLNVCVHDRGLLIAWRQIVRWEWRFAPPPSRQEERGWKAGRLKKIGEGLYTLPNENPAGEVSGTDAPTGLFPNHQQGREAGPGGGT